MTAEAYKDLLTQSLQKNYTLSASYLGEPFDIAGLSKTTDEYENREVCLISFGLDEQAVQDELYRLPEIALSGMRATSKNKVSVVLRAFVMERASYELTKEVRTYTFAKAVRGQFWSYAEAQIVLVDLATETVYTNLAGEIRKAMFVFTET